MRNSRMRNCAMIINEIWMRKEMKRNYGNYGKTVPEGNEGIYKGNRAPEKSALYSWIKPETRIKEEKRCKKKYVRQCAKMRNRALRSRCNLKQKRANTVNEMRCALKIKSRRGEKFRRGKKFRRDKRTFPSDPEVEDGGQIKLPEVEGRAAAPTATARVRVDRL